MNKERVAVEISSRAKKQLKRVPQHVGEKLLAWILLVVREGLEEARKIPGYHDEPLKGKRSGQRSIRLSKAYRAIYRMRKDGFVEIAVVMEVSKHGY